jgi:hypothetical protein
VGGAAGEAVQTKEMTMMALLLVPLLLLFAFAAPFRWLFGGGLWGRGLWGRGFWGRPVYFRHHHGCRPFHGGHFRGRR